MSGSDQRRASRPLEVDAARASFVSVANELPADPALARRVSDAVAHVHRAAHAPANESATTELVLDRALSLADTTRGAVLLRANDQLELLAQRGFSSVDEALAAARRALRVEHGGRGHGETKNDELRVVPMRDANSQDLVLVVGAGRNSATSVVLRLFAALVAPALDTRRATTSSTPRRDSRRAQPVAESVIMQQIAATLKQLAATSVPVLLLGERGVGKRFLAYYMHTCAGNGSPLCEIECLRPTHEVESEIQRFESLYSAGTLLLHRVDELPSSAQARLAKLFRNGHGEGTHKPPSSVGSWRIVCTSEVPLHQLITERRLRDDMMSVVGTVTLNIPPLRDRPDDVVALATSFLRTARQSPQASFSATVLRQLRRHNWPGNVLELKRLVEYLAIFGDGDTISQIPPLFTPAGASSGVGGSLLVPFGTPLKEIEEKLISATLDRTGNKKSRTAEILKVDRVTLYRRLKRTIPGTTII